MKTPSYMTLATLSCLVLASLSFGQSSFTETFEDGVPDGWTNVDIGAYETTALQAHTGSYALELGIDGNMTTLMRDEFEASGGIYEVWLYTERPAQSELGIVFQATDERGFYSVYFRPMGSGDQELTLEKRFEGVDYELGYVNHSVGVDQWVHIEVHRYVQGARRGDIEVYLNGVLQISVNDQTYLSPSPMAIYGRYDTFVDDIAYTPMATDCCVQRVGDANMSGDDEPTIGDIALMIDSKFISMTGSILPCMTEADINQSGGSYPVYEDVTLGDIAYLIDYLFISMGTIELAACLPAASPPPPQHPVGLMVRVGNPGEDGVLTAVFMWVDSLKSFADGYNLYRTVGLGTPVKLNEDLILEMPFGPGPEPTPALGFLDQTLDTLSSEPHRYFITTVYGGTEGYPSDEVVFVPSEFDEGLEVTGLNPVNGTEVGYTPSFSWTPYPDAQEYFVIVQDMDGYSDLLWAALVSESTADYRQSDVITYADRGVASLPFCHEIYWGVYAVNAANFLMARGDANVIAPCEWMTVYDCPSLSAGSWSVCWDQTDVGGMQVPEGTYKAILDFGHNLLTQMPTVVFEIEAGGGSTVVPSDCNPSCDSPPGSSLPVRFMMTTPVSSYGVGETVVLEFDLPQASDPTIIVSPMD